MVGEYPFVNGSSCKDYNAGEARLQQALKAGVTAFASVLSELPSQAKMPIGGVDDFVPYKPTADLIAAGAFFSATAVPSCARTAQLSVSGGPGNCHSSIQLMYRNRH